MCSLFMRLLLMQSKDGQIVIRQAPNNFLCSKFMSIDCFLDCENDFPHSNSARLTLPVPTFFGFNYAEVHKLKLEVHIVCY